MAGGVVVHVHRAELEKLEVVSVQADALLTEEDWTRRVAPDDDGDDGQQWREQGE